MEDKFPFFTSPIVFPYYLVIWKSYGAKKVRSAGMDNLWNNDKKTSHTISKEILQKTNMSILWEMYGECTPIDLPYNEEHQLFFPYVSHSLNFA